MEHQIAHRSKVSLEGAAEAVVVHCSDHRFQASFREFLTDGLGLRAYALLALPGGGHFLSLAPMMPKFAKAGLQSISFLVKRAKPPKIILVGHDDCLFFKEKGQFFCPEATLNQKQFANLRRARGVLHEQFPALAVELYFADAPPGDAVHFLKIE